MIWRSVLHYSSGFRIEKFHFTKGERGAREGPREGLSRLEREHLAIEGELGETKGNSGVDWRVKDFVTAPQGPRRRAIRPPRSLSTRD